MEPTQPRATSGLDDCISFFSDCYLIARCIVIPNKMTQKKDYDWQVKQKLALEDAFMKHEATIKELEKLNSALQDSRDWLANVLAKQLGKAQLWGDMVIWDMQIVDKDEKEIDIAAHSWIEMSAKMTTNMATPIKRDGELSQLQAENAKLKQWLEQANDSNHCLKAILREMIDYV